MTPKTPVSARIQKAWHYKYGLGNDKVYALYESTGIKTATFDLLAGVSCPAAMICKGHAQNGRVVLGKDAAFVCYAAKTEAYYPNSYKAHRFNLQTVNASLRDYGVMQTACNIAQDIDSSGFGIIRIHASGDFFKDSYTNMWIQVAHMLPNVMFFGYTKVMQAYRMLTNVNYDNLGFAFSIGSMHDSLVKESDVTSHVVTPDYLTRPVDYVRYGIQVTQEFYNARFNRWLPVICGNHKDRFGYSVDFHYIMNRESFGIGLH